MLRNAVGGGRVSDFPEKTLRRCTVQRYKHYEGWVCVKFPEKKLYVTLEWPLMVHVYSFLILQVASPDHPTLSSRWKHCQLQYQRTSSKYSEAIV